MNNIQLNIVANAQFQQVYAEVAKLKAAMTSLQKSSVGGPFTANVTADIKASQSAFDSAVLSTRAFNIQQVAMTDSVTKFGQQLSKGQLSLSNYYKIWRDSAKGASAEIDSLATAQARLNRSIAIADPLKPGYAKLVTDINGVVTAEEKLIFKQQALNTALQQGSMKLVDFGKNTQWMGRQLTVGLTMPLAMFGAAASQAYLKFDQQMTDMLKVYGSHAVVQSQATLDLIQKQVTALADKLARTLGVAMSDTVEVAKTFSSIGLEGQNLIAATEATVKLQKLGGLSANQAATSMVALQNVFKLQSNQIAEAVNFLNAAKHSTSTTMQDIVDALPRVGPIIQQMGGTYKDFATLLVSLKESGVPAAQGANAIKSMLASMINPTSAATKALSALHINLKQIVSSNNGNLIGMVEGLQSALNALPKNERLKAIEQVFGKFQFARVTALLQNLGTAGSQSAKVLELYQASNTQLAAVAQQELDVASKGTPAARFQTMKQTLQADLIPLGRSFLETFTKIGNAIGNIIGAFRSFANLLGPAAGLLGKIFGGGLAGLIIIGPIIMLVGLFSNLIGNILRGANAIRMFKQGLASAAPGENAFLAGLHGMRNFYQELDTSVIAARNQMDLMPEAITSNAKAFEILRNEIVMLTDQFKLLAVAQTSAMGGSGLSAIGTALAPASTRFLPIVKKNFGGSIPGFASGGMIYDPSKHGSTVPGPSNVNYDSVLASVPKGGFVLNKKASQANPGLASIPRFNSGGNMLAMLTPGETVFDPATTAANYSMLNATNRGSSIGGSISSLKDGYGDPAEMAALVMRAAREGNLPSSLVGKATAEIKKSGLLSYLRKEREVKASGSFAARTISHAEAVLKGYIKKIVSPGHVVDTTSPWGIKLSQEQVDKIEGYKSPTQVNSALKANSMDGTAFAEMIKSTTGKVSGSFDSFIDLLVRSRKISITEAEELKNKISNRYLESVTGRIIGDSNNPYADVVLHEMESLLKKDPEIANAFMQFSNSMPVFRSGPAQRKPYIRSDGTKGTQGRGSKYNDLVVTLNNVPYSISHDNFKGSGSELFLHTTQPEWAGVQHLAKGGAIGAHHRKSPVYSYTGSDVYRGQTRRMKASLGVHYNSYKAPHTRGLKGWNSGGPLPGYAGGGALTSSLGTLSNVWKFGSRAAPIGEEAMTASRMSGMMRMGTGSGIGMIAPMLLNSIPSKIGGTDIGAAKGALSSASSMAGMAMMLGASGPAALAIGGAVVALKGVSWWFGKIKKDAAEHQTAIKNSFSVSTTAITLFNNSLNKSEKQLALNIRQLKNDDPLKKMADYIKTLPASSAIGTLKTFVASQVVSGMDPKNVEKMTKAILTYTGQLNLIPAAVKEITKGNQDLTTSVKTYVEKLDAASKSSDTLTTKYKDLSLNGKIYADSMYSVFNALGTGAIKGNNISNTLIGLQSNTADATKQFNMLKLGAQQAGDTKMSAIITSVQSLISNANVAIGVMGRLQAMQSAGADISAFVADNSSNLAGAASDPKKVKTAMDAGIAVLKQQYQDAKTQEAKSGAATTSDQISATKQKIKDQNVIKKQLDEQLKVMQQQANTISQQNDYLNKQTDLTQQIKTAEISGNYITAAQLKQQQSANTSKYNQQLAIDSQQQKVDAQQTLLNDLNDTLNNLQDTLSTAAAALSSASGALLQQIKAAQSQEDVIMAQLNKVTPPPSVKTRTVGPNKDLQELGPDGQWRTVQWNNTQMDPAGYVKPDSLYGTYSSPLYKGSTDSKSFKDLGLGSSYKLKDIGGNWNAADSNRELIKSFALQQKIGSGSYFTLTDSMKKTYEFLVKKDHNVEMISKNVNLDKNAQTAANATIGTQTNTIYISGAGDPTKVAELVIQKLKVGAAKSNTTNRVVP